MSVQILDPAEPFFGLRLISDESDFELSGKVILLNLSETPIGIGNQFLGPLQSAVVTNTRIHDIAHAVIVERFADYPDEDALFRKVREMWPSAFDVRKEERLRGIAHYMSPKIWKGRFGFTMYHSGSVPLNVGLHRDHAFCPVPGFREVHTQVVGFGKMQQCRENDLSTLYLEEPMAPGATHRPMYDEHGNYPWHQYETITPSIFLAVEMLPEGATPRPEEHTWPRDCFHPSGIQRVRFRFFRVDCGLALSEEGASPARKRTQRVSVTDGMSLPARSRRIRSRHMRAA